MYHILTMRQVPLTRKSSQNGPNLLTPNVTPAITMRPVTSRNEEGGPGNKGRPGYELAVAKWPGFHSMGGKARARSSKRERRQAASNSLTFQLTMTTASSGCASLTMFVKVPSENRCASNHRSRPRPRSRPARPVAARPPAPPSVLADSPRRIRHRPGSCGRIPRCPAERRSP